MLDKEINIDAITLLVGLATQFGGIVWQVSRFKSQLTQVVKKVDKLEQEAKEDREKFMPLAYRFDDIMRGIQAQLDRLEDGMKEVRIDIKDTFKKESVK